MGENTRRGATLLLLTIAYVFSSMDRMILSVMIGPIQRDLQISDTEFSLLQGFAFAIFYALAGLPIGWMVDRWPRRNIVACGMALWSAMTAMSGMANSFVHLLLARIGVGVGEAALSPAAYSMMTDMFPRHRLGRALGIYSSGSMIGIGLAFIFGGVLIQELEALPRIDLPLVGVIRSWQAVFLIVGLPGLLLSLVIMALVHEPPRSITTPAQVSDDETMTGFLRRTWFLIVLIFIGTAALQMVFAGFMSWMPAMLMRNHGISPAEAGLAVGIASAVFAMAGLIGGGVTEEMFSRRTGRLQALPIGIWSALLAIPFIVLTTFGSSLPLIVGSGCVLFLILVSSYGPVVATLQLLCPPALRGRLSALLILFLTIMGFGSGTLIVALFTDFVFQDRLAINKSLAALGAIGVPLTILSYSLAISRLERALKAGLPAGG